MKITRVELMRLAFCDELTGLFNRRAFVRSPQPQAVILADVDGLKWLNDSKGHREGDALLIRTANDLVSWFGQDTVYRLAGDEFAIALPSLALAKLAYKIIDLPYLSLGVGLDLAEADASLRSNKTARELSGARSPRGETPAWLQLKRI